MGCHSTNGHALTAKQQRFVEEYLKDLNAAAAYRRAGYKVSSDEVAWAHGSRLVGNGKVAAAIAEAQKARAARVHYDQDWVIKHLLIEAQERGDGASHGARVKAIELLAKHLGMLVDRVKVEGGIRLELIEEIVDAPSDLLASETSH